jgi:hypothetical protein
MRARLVLIAIAATAVIGLDAAPRMLQREQAPGSRRVSPHESVDNNVDGAELTIVYGRPSMRGRTIFGSLVPFGRVWCPGADEATTLESTKELMLGTLRIPTGPHTIWVLPTAEQWTLIVSKNPRGFHTFYDPQQDLGRLELHKQELSAPVEQLTFAITKAVQGGGTISMTWERTEVSAPFTVAQ